MARTTKANDRKGLSCILETLRDGSIRVTSRERGRTICYKDGAAGSEVKLVETVMSESFGAHRTRSGYCMEYIDVNEPVMNCLKVLGYALT